MRLILYPIIAVCSMSLAIEFVLMLFALREYSTCQDDLCRIITTNAKILILEIIPITVGSFGLGIVLERRRKEVI